MSQSPAIVRLLDELIKPVHGISLTEARERIVCVICKNVPNDQNVRTEEEVKEFAISNMCGVCFDIVFADQEEDEEEDDE